MGFLEFLKLENVHTVCHKESFSLFLDKNTTPPTLSSSSSSSSSSLIIGVTVILLLLIIGFMSCIVTLYKKHQTRGKPANNVFRSLEVYHSHLFVRIMFIVVCQSITFFSVE